MKLKKRCLLALGVALLGVAAGCAKPEEGNAGSGGSAGGSQGGSGKSALTIKGSDTMVQLAQAWAQAFMKAHPEIEVTVTGGGSNTGIAALVNKSTDIANASRPMKQEEKDAAKKNGVDVHEFVVAQDALSIIVNPANPVTELTFDQLKDLYTGKVTNWKQVGGPDMKIVLNGRESSSGSFVFFQEHVLNKAPYASEVLQQPATSQIVDNVAQDKGGIGYVGLGYVTARVKAVKIKQTASSSAIAGTVENVINKTYPLARPLFEYTAGEPAAAAKTWLDWVAGTEGQELVKRLEFVPIK